MSLVLLSHGIDEVDCHCLCTRDFDFVGAGYVQVCWFVGFAARGDFVEAGVLAFYLDSGAGFGGDVFYVGALMSEKKTTKKTSGLWIWDGQKRGGI